MRHAFICIEETCELNIWNSIQLLEPFRQYISNTCMHMHEEKPNLSTYHAMVAEETNGLTSLFTQHALFYILDLRSTFLIRETTLCVQNSDYKIDNIQDCF